MTMKNILIIEPNEHVRGLYRMQIPLQEEVNDSVVTVASGIPQAFVEMRGMQDNIDCLAISPGSADEAIVKESMEFVEMLRKSDPFMIIIGTSCMPATRAEQKTAGANAGLEDKKDLIRFIADLAKLGSKEDAIEFLAKQG